MFDADVGDGKIYRESDYFYAGNQLVTARTRNSIHGLSICYDVRFPEMYRKMSQAGAK